MNIDHETNGGRPSPPPLSFWRNGKPPQRKGRTPSVSIFDKLDAEQHYWFMPGSASVAVRTMRCPASR